MSGRSYDVGGEIVLEHDPVQSRWNTAAQAICNGELAEAARIADDIGHRAAAAYTHLRAAQAFAADGRDIDAVAHRVQADAFHAPCRANRFAGRGDPASAAEADQAAS